MDGVRTPFSGLFYLVRQSGAFRTKAGRIDEVVRSTSSACAIVLRNSFRGFLGGLADRAIRDPGCHPRAELDVAGGGNDRISDFYCMVDETMTRDTHALVALAPINR